MKCIGNDIKVTKKKRAKEKSSLAFEPRAYVFTYLRFYVFTYLRFYVFTFLRVYEGKGEAV